MAESRGGDRRSFLRSALVGAGALGGAALTGRPAAAATGGRTSTRSTTVGGGSGGKGWSAERRLRELGIRLPPPDPQQQAPMLVPGVRSGDLLFMSGHGPREDDGYITGKVGGDLTEEQGNAAARAAGANMLAAVRGFLDDDLDRVARVVKVLGMVNATPDFTRQSQVINGFSGLMIEVFGDAGRAARSAVGVGSLPFNWAVEVEAIFEIRS